MPLILTILIHLTLFWILAAFFQLVWLSVLRVKVTAVTLFYGKTPLKLTVAGCPVSIGWIPLGSSVSFNPTDFQRRAWAVRILVHLSSAVIGFGTAILLLGFPEASHHFFTGFRQIAEGAWEPVARAGGYLTQWQEEADTAPVKAFGILAAKGSAFSLFPIGGGVITQILADAGTSTGKELLEKMSVLNAVACFMIIALWGFAVLWLALFG